MSPRAPATAYNPPDGGWGWVVCFASFMIHVIADGVTYTFSIFYEELGHHFKVDKETTAWIPSILAGITLGAGPLVSALINKFGCRVVCVSGAVISSFGWFLSAFAPSVVFLYVSIGVISGIGFSLMYVPAIVAVTSYFERRRGLATGIAVSGSGLGTFILSPLLTVLVENYSLQGGMMFVSGIVFLCTIFGAFYKSLHPPPLEVAEDVEGTLMTANGVPTNCVINREELLQDKPKIIISEDKDGSDSAYTGSVTSIGNGKGMASSAASKGPPIHATPWLNKTLLNLIKEDGFSSSTPELNVDPGSRTDSPQPPPVTRTSRRIRAQSMSEASSPNRRKNSLQLPHFTPMMRKDIFYSGSVYHPEDIPPVTVDEEPNTCRDMLDLHILLDPVYLVFAVSNFFTSVGFIVPYVFVKGFAEELELAPYASRLISVMGIANTCGRLILGYIADRKKINRLNLYNTVITICGIGTALCSWSQSYAAMMAYVITFGVTSGAYVGLTSVICADLVGIEKLTNAFGPLFLVQGIATLIGPPFAGALVDAYGYHRPAFQMAGTVIAASGLMLFFIPLIRNYQDYRKKKKTGGVGEFKNLLVEAEQKTKQLLATRSGSTSVSPTAAVANGTTVTVPVSGSCGQSLLAKGSTLPPLLEQT